MCRMSRRLWIPIAAVVALALVGGAGAYAYFFSGLRSAPSALTLSSPTALATASSSASPTAGGNRTASWKVTSGSVAGYRVTEQFAGQSSTHEAVSRTSGVTGDVSIKETGGTTVLSSAKITVDLSSLASVDSV